MVGEKEEKFKLSEVSQNLAYHISGKALVAHQPPSTATGEEIRIVYNGFYSYLYDHATRSNIMLLSRSLSEQKSCTGRALSPGFVLSVPGSQ